jgi:FKBP-type peptidyl-prolyl cis-trans isomerase
MDPSGFYYKINDPGTDPKPGDLCTTIAAFYRVGYFNGVGIDSTAGTPAVFLLGNVIPGWQKAIPLIGTNGNMDIYIPPSLAYGSSDYQVGDIIIRGNSYLVFHVVLAQVQ